MQTQIIKNNFKPAQQINVDKNVTIELTPVELSTIVAYLRKGIYEQVALVIGSIEKQVVQQLMPDKEENIKERVVPENNVGMI